MEKKARIETIAEMQRRLICKALNKTSTFKDACLLLAPKGYPTHKTIREMITKYNIYKDSKGVYI